MPLGFIVASGSPFNLSFTDAKIVIKKELRKYKSLIINVLEKL